jgi:diguanylate cyclase (GGDEF)-like protein/PAS domain S-box-containing protein
MSRHTDLERRILELESENSLLRKEIGWLGASFTKEVNDATGKVDFADRLSLQREHSLRSMLDKMPAMICYWDKELHNRFCNKAYSTWFGVPPEQLMGKHVRELLGDKVFNLNLPYIEAALCGEPQKFERAIPAPDGSGMKYLLVEYIPDIVDGEVQGYFVQISDISVLKQAEEALRQSREILKQSEERYRTVVQDQTDLISRLRTDGTYIFANEVFLRFFGKTVAEIIGQTWSPLVYPDDLARVIEELAMLSPTNPVVMIENRVYSGDGRVHWMQFSNRGTFDATGKLIEIQSVGRDITERKQIEARIKETLAESERFRRALDLVPAYIYMKDLQHRYTYANQLTLQLFGCSEAELVGSEDSRFFPPGTVKRLYEIDERVFSGENSREEIDIPDAASGHRVYWEVKAPIYEDHKQEAVCGLVGISTDITEHKELETKLEHQAHTDYLTKLPNRSYFYEQMEKEFARDNRYHTPLSIAMVDIDHFKVINDTYGHEIGDRVLKEFARVCLETLREQDIVGRIGGEEFAILFPETGMSHAMEVAERLRQAIANFRLPMERGLPVQFTVSLGVASLTDADMNIDVFLSRADIALYEAKKNGRNRTCGAKNPE